MEYEKKYRPKFYQVLILIIYSAAVVYTVLVNNPYLYSSKLYQEALAGKKDNSYQPVITKAGKERSSISKPQPPSRLNWSKSNAEDSGETRDRRYTEVTMTPVLMELDKKPQSPQWTMYQDHIILTTPESRVYAVDYEGKTLWQFFSENTKGHRFLPEPTADANSIYLVNTNGRIYNLFLKDGRLIWSIQREGQFLSDTFLLENSLFVVNKTETVKDVKKTPVTTTRLLKISRINGEMEAASEDLGLKQPTEYSFHFENKVLFLTSGEKLVALKLPEMESLWQKSLSSEVVGPAVLTEDKVIVSLKEGKVKIFSQSKGTEIHEVDLEHPLASAPTFVPIYNRIAVTATDGYQHVIDVDGGKRLWRFDLNNNNNISTAWSARLSGNFIEELSMKWIYKGWTIWSPCVNKRICIYNPEKGQIVGRVMLSGQLSSLPRFKERSFYVLLETESGYAIGHYMERPAAKKVSQKTDEESSSTN